MLSFSWPLKHPWNLIYISIVKELVEEELVPNAFLYVIQGKSKAWIEKMMVDSYHGVNNVMLSKKLIVHKNYFENIFYQPQQ